MRARLAPPLLLLSLLASSCGGEAPVPAKAPPTRGPSVAALPAATEYPPERPLTSAKLGLITDFGFAPSLGDPYTSGKAYVVAGGAVGYLDTSGHRTTATLEEIKHVADTIKLRDLCVADDGKVTSALWAPPGGGASHVGQADSFTGTFKDLGAYLAQLEGHASGNPQTWLVSHEKDGVLVVECRSGQTERVVADTTTSGTLLFYAPSNALAQLRPKVGPSYCVTRGAKGTPWTKLPECWMRSRGDGLDLVETRVPKSASKCLFLLDAKGQKLPCTTPEGPAFVGKLPPPTNERLVASARFYAPSKIVLPWTDNALHTVGPNGKLSEAKRVDGTDGLVQCEPLVPHAAIFKCSRGERSDVVVSVDAQGRAKEELTRTRPAAGKYPGQFEETSFHVTADGAIAVGGDCDGALGQVACVRSTSGAWKSVPFSKELVTALSRTAPATRLLPTPDGGLYVATGTMDGLLTGNIKILLFHANEGGAVEVQKIPMWILGSLSGLGALAGASSSSTGIEPMASWRTSRQLRIWPMEREHPAFKTKESCRLDVGIDGTFDASCVQGRVFSSGRASLWEKGPGDLEETLDAGETWKRIALPRGVDTADVACSSLGCRIGPYWRSGWGP
jgi:hypothetical protein